jgi:hypothetical protein
MRRQGTQMVSDCTPVLTTFLCLSTFLSYCIGRH